jgi:myo-inositol-1(or 4)-monophosphatase
MTADAFIKDIAVKTGEAVWKRFGKDGVLKMKSSERFDTLTKADLMAERMVIRGIRKHFPSHGIRAEESGAKNADAEYVWAIDPIDGTTNFALGIPFFGVMLALIRKDTVVLSAIYIPATKELFFAKKGKGAFRNGKRIRSAKTRDLAGSHGMLSPYIHARDRRLAENLFAKVKAKQYFVHALGSKIGFCYVAAGLADWKVSLGGALHDFAAPYLILTEAGCKATDSKGKPWTVEKREMWAANPVLHKKLMKLAKGV